MNRDSDGQDHSSKDERLISNIYQQASTELPSSDLDKNILWQARNAIDNRHLDKVGGDENSVVNVKVKKSWLKWQWGGSVMASVLLLSVVLIINGPEQELLRAPIDEFQSPSRSASAMSDSELASVDTMSQSMLINEQDGGDIKESKTRMLEVAGSSDVNEINSVAIDEAIIASNTNAGDEQYSSLEQNEPSSETLDALLVQVKANRRREQTSKEGINREAAFQQLKRAKESLKVTPDLYLSEVKLDAEVEGLVQKIRQLQRVLYNTELQNAEDEKRFMDKLTATQIELIALLKLRKQQKTDWQLLPRYSDALTPDQSKALQEEFESR